MQIITLLQENYYNAKLKVNYKYILNQVFWKDNRVLIPIILSSYNVTIAPCEKFNVSDNNTQALTPTQRDHIIELFQCNGSNTKLETYDYSVAYHNIIRSMLIIISMALFLFFSYKFLQSKITPYDKI